MTEDLEYAPQKALRGGTRVSQLSDRHQSSRLARAPIYWALFLVAALPASAQDTPGLFRPSIPKVWDERALQDMELAVVVPKYSPKPVSADYYYRIPARAIYKSYPIYAPGRAPAGYLEKLKMLPPEVAFDAAQLKTKADWLRAGEMVFEAPTAYDVPGLGLKDVSDPNWYAETRPPLTSDGILPHLRYVIREKGKAEVGSLACATCHLSVLTSGAVMQAGQGNFPLDRVNAFVTRRSSLQEARHQFLLLFAIPWIPEPEP